MNKRVLIYSIIINTVFTSQALYAKEEKKKPEFSGEIGLGAEYDSNVSVSELDQTTQEDDQAVTFDADFDLKLPITNSTEISASYGYSEVRYQVFDELDLTSHFVSADISQELGNIEIGFTYRQILANLDGERFLTLKQLSPHAAIFLGKKAYWRLDYTQADKTIEGRPERDADSDAVGSDFYWFINGSRTYLSVGYKFSQEDAVDPALDYDGNTFKIKLTKRFGFNKLDGALKIGASYEQRDYQNDTAALGEPRQDDRTRLQTELELPISNHLNLLLNLEYADYQSNYLPADYDQYIAGAQLVLDF